MSLIAIGLSFRSAPVAVLERLAAAPASIYLDRLICLPSVREVVALSTCNRTEVYADVVTFHGGLSEIGTVLAEQAGVAVDKLAPQMYVRHDIEAVRHAFKVAAGLDSMVVGEEQIAGQLRAAYALATQAGTTGRLIHELMQQALRVSKRVRTETQIDHAGESLATAALSLVRGGVSGRHALVIGAGAMGGLALAALVRGGAGALSVANRNPDRACELGSPHGASLVQLDQIAAALSVVDIAISATAALEPVITEELVRAAIADREPGRLLSIVDLAMPRDVEMGVGALPGVELINLETVAAVGASRPAEAEVAAAEEIVASEVGEFGQWLHGAQVGPTLAALRARADEVVEAELRRLQHRAPDLSQPHRREVAHMLHRVVRQLLHAPTVKIRYLASMPDGDEYTALLRELFDLSLPDARGGYHEAIADDGGSGATVADDGERGVIVADDGECGVIVADDGESVVSSTEVRS